MNIRSFLILLALFSFVFSLFNVVSNNYSAALMLFIIFWRILKYVNVENDVREERSGTPCGKIHPVSRRNAKSSRGPSWTGKKLRSSADNSPLAESSAGPT